MTKINLIIDFLRREISEIKLKRTDTTLDLSQKAKRAKERKRKRGRASGLLYTRERMPGRKCDITSVDGTGKVNSPRPVQCINDHRSNAYEHMANST